MQALFWRMGCFWSRAVSCEDFMQMKKNKKNKTSKLPLGSWSGGLTGSELNENIKFFTFLRVHLHLSGQKAMRIVLKLGLRVILFEVLTDRLLKFWHILSRFVQKAGIVAYSRWVRSTKHGILKCTRFKSLIKPFSLFLSLFFFT